MEPYNAIDNLQKYGNVFQIKCISSILSDQKFIERIYDIIELDFFESDAQRWIVDETLKYFIKYKTLPTLEVFKVRVDTITNEVLKLSIVDTLSVIYKNISSTDISFIKKEFLNFCKNQAMKKAISESVNLLSVGDYNKIYTTMESALKAGMEKDHGHDYVNDMHLRLSDTWRNSIKTNWDVIDKTMNGGLAAKELGIVTACAGAGKSWLLTKLGTEAIKQGKNVLHITLELDENYVGLRYDSVFTSIKFTEIRNHVNIIQENMKKLKGELRIKYFTSRTVSATDIKLYCERLKMSGFIPDMLIIDYADILSPHSKYGRDNNSYSTAGNIYDEVRMIAGQLNLPIWTASQANREALSADIIQADSISDSYKKIMIGDFIISLSRKVEDKMSNTGRLHVIKNRFGPDGITFPVKFDASNGQINVFCPDSPEGYTLTNEMRNSETQFRQTVKTRLNQLNQLNNKN